MNLRDAHIDEQNDAAIESMIEDAKGILAESRTWKDAHLILVRVMAKNMAQDERERGFIPTLAKQADLTSCLLLKLAQLKNEIASK
jgi:hypothetical protein